jgi:hypothetical protein
VSLQTTGTASTDRGSTAVSITAAGGDYFYFHPLQLKSGSTFSDADLQHDTIVLDENDGELGVSVRPAAEVVD